MIQRILEKNKIFLLFFSQYFYMGLFTIFSMRVFVAVDTPKSVVEELKMIQKSLREAELKLVKDFHLTLKFLGDVPEPRIEMVKEALKKIKFKPFKTQLTEIGVFPNPNYIKVVWVGISPDNFISLQKQVDDVFEKLGFKRDKRFHPHLTLARVKFVKDKEGFKKTLREIKVEKWEFEVNEFKLIKSMLTKQGPIYEDLAVFKLIL